jgi:signal transduction histidine kinase
MSTPALGRAGGFALRVDQLTERVGLDTERRMRRLAFLGIEEAERADLAELLPFAEEVVDELVESFYGYILGFPETARFLTDPHLVTRLKALQREHLLSLFRGRHDVAYFESRLRVGFAHAQIGLEPVWYLGAYTIQMRFLLDRCFERFAAEPARLARYLTTLLKIIMLDIALATDAYIYGGFVERSLAEAHAREAERANEALRAKETEEARREQLLNMVVHDIRSPVTAMIASARVGLRRHPDAQTPPGKQFSLIEDSGRSVLDIIDNMLAIARLSQGVMPVTLESFDVAEVVRTCVEELRAFAQQTGHGLSVEGPEEVMAASLDRTLVRRILFNLIVNGLRHTPAGTHVAVRFSAHEGLCAIRVHDDGPGLSPRVAERIFGDREAGDLSRQRAGGRDVASGLGLPFCRMACERLGGQLRLDHRHERGACFVVELPTA